MKKRLYLKITLMLAFAYFISTPSCFSNQTRPLISLFNHEVISSSKTYHSNFQDVNDSLDPTFSEIEKVKNLYKKKDCAPESSNKSCIKLKKRMQNVYLKMLDQLEETLPELEESLEKANNVLGKRIKDTVGNRMTPEQLFKSIGQYETKSHVKRKKTSIAKRLSRLHDIIGKKVGGAPEVRASKLFLDQTESLTIIASLRTEIPNQRHELETQIKLGTFDQGLIAALEEVRSVLFEEEEGEILPEEDEGPGEKSMFEDLD